MVEWSVFVGELIATHDYDLGCVALTNGGSTPEARSVYTEEGSLNLFQLDREIPYGNESEQMQDLGVTISDLDERQQLYYDWQQLMMDKIVPLLPMFSPRFYTSIWSNTEGYDMRWGFEASAPYMTYNGLHEGQESADEFNIRDAMWSELNPLFSDDTSSTWIYGLTADSMLRWSPDNAPLKTGLIDDWEQITSDHFKFYLRDGIYWNPSFNVTERTSSSGPLVTETSPGVWEVTDVGELMVGLKDGTYSDGTNKQVTAIDTVFTYLAYGNLNISEDPSLAEWISDIYVDPLDNLAFHVFVDGNPDTPEVEPFIDFFAGMTGQTLPEFFLNSTDTQVTYSGGGIPTVGMYDEMVNTPQWIAFSESCFGHGPFMFDYYVPSSVSVHTRSPFWSGIGAIDGVGGKTPFVETVNTRVIPDDSASLAEFKAGKLDILGVTSFPEERKLMQADPRFEVQTEIRDYYLFIFYNLKRPFLGGADNFVFLDAAGKEEYTKGVAVRKAMNYAVDREEMNQVLHDGEYTLCHNPMYLYTAFYYYDDVIKYYRDLDAAIEWLGYAGYFLDVEPTPLPILGIVAAIGVGAALLLYRKKK
ncbi:MAG: ABC transporter substrate-binding protein [Candidatus Heimdallarchaeaceae archaeon]|jgi:ABC-type transport system substrate-binding protein